MTCLLNMKSLARGLLGALLVAMATSAGASGYFHRTWQSEEGLPQNSAQAVVQADDGYLWIGTQDGLARFDGIRFTVFNQDNTPQLRARSVTALLQDREGAVWIGTDGGGVSLFRQGEFRHFREIPELTEAVIRAFHQTRDGAIWIGSTNGLTRYREGNFKTFTVEDGLPANAVRAILEDVRGHLWVGTGAGLAQFRGGEITPASIAVSRPGFILSLAQTRDETIWIGSTAGLTRHRDGKFETFQKEHGLSDIRVSALHEDSAGVLWAGTFNGLNQRQPDGRFVEITNSGAPYDLIYSIIEDHENGIWVGTKDGLSQLHPRVFSAYTRQHGLADHAVVSVLEDREGTIWIGTWGGGLSFLRDGKMHAFTGMNRQLILALHEGRDGALWIGTDYSGGLFRWKDGAIKRYSSGQGLADSALTAIHEDRSGNLWVGSAVALNLFRNGRVERRFTTEEGLPGNRVRAIYETRAGELWIATDGGLARWVEGGFESFTAGLPHPSVLSIFEDSEAGLWITTEAGGIARFSNGRFVQLAANEGPLSQRLFHLLEDNFGYFWMSSRHGVFRISRNRLRAFERNPESPVEYDSFGKRDGLASGRCNGVAQPSGWKSRDGRLWFPTIKGLAVVEPGKVRRNEFPPPVKIEEVVFRNEPVMIGRSLRLPFFRHDVEIHYTALSFHRPEKLRFEYMLEGFDSGWVDAGNRRIAFYNNLPPGDYRFVVRACNDLGIWNTQEAALEVSLPPAFYQSAWFYAGCVGIAACLLVVWHRCRVRRIEVRERELVRLVDERTSELRESVESLESFCYTIAHDLRAPLRAMQGLSIALVDDYADSLDATGSDYARRIAAASVRMDKMIQDLLIYGRLSHMEIELNPIDLNEVVGAVLCDLQEEIKSRNASVHFERRLPRVRASAIVLNQILNNLLSNALKFVDSDVTPHLHIWAVECEGTVRLWIKDNGIGIEPKYHERIFKVFERLNPSARYPGTGIGLAIVQKGAERMGGRIGVQSERHKGSAFWIELPLADVS